MTDEQMTYDRARKLFHSTTPVKGYARLTGREDWAAHLEQLIPGHCQYGLAAWILFGWKPGDFLTAVIQNDFMRACSRADGLNRLALFNYAYFLHNAAPGGCFGSMEKYRSWQDQHGLIGQQIAETT